MKGRASDRLGDVFRDRDRWTLRFERDLRHPPERVWTALTSSEDLRSWFPCDLVGERRAGAPLRLPFWSEHIELYEEKYAIEAPELTGTIRVWDPVSTFEWSWDVDVLRFELSPIPGGTRLVFTTWLALLGDEPLDGPVADTGAGYHLCLDELEAVLDVGKAGPIDDSPVGHLLPLYASMIERQI